MSGTRNVPKIRKLSDEELKKWHDAARLDDCFYHPDSHPNPDKLAKFRNPADGTSFKFFIRNEREVRGNKKTKDSLSITPAKKL